ncbi:hypothetical protein B0T24DRAFT_668951 [Lasiosphaeria ovina]|uniref:Zn(2)-C6 fungal-type domain-containing protein n=1 Tax=Lasiosphaeria ovina TaxID=92902 RepID=A0AAE0K4Y6_9PEZI|nr:hypothetical protein B0T24DRAFT_668951 [Lasiosphaeria ovina]
MTSPADPKRIPNLSILQPSGFLVLGRQLRHAACDRCRSQKLRCQYDGPDKIPNLAYHNGIPDMPCQRCQRAGTECVQSPTVRVGRPLSSNKEGRTQKAKRRQATSRSSPSSVTGTEGSTISHLPNIHTGQDKRLKCSEGDAAAVGAPQIHEMSQLHLDFEFNMLDLTSFGPSPPDLGGQQMCLPNATSSTTDLTQHVNDPLGQNLRDVDMHRTSEQYQMHSLTPNSLNTAFSDPHMFVFDQSPISDDTMFDMTFPAAVPPPENPGLGLTPPPSLPPYQHRKPSLDLGTLPPKDVQEPPPQPSAATDDSRHCMGPRASANLDATVQKIFTVSASLYSLAAETARISKPTSHPFGCEGYPVEGILCVTQSFVDILELFVPATCSDCVTEFGLREPQTPTDTSESGFGGQPETNVKPEEQQLTGGDGPGHHVALPDVHTTLAIVSCYTRLMCIYSNLIQYMHDAFQPGAAHGQSRMANLPGLKFGRIQIQQDCALQALLLVQLGAHLMERIDRLLGALASLTGGESQGGSRVVTPPSPGGPGRPGSSSPYSRPTGAVQRVSHVQSMLELAVRQDDHESMLAGRRGIGSLKGDFGLLEQMLRQG